MDIDKLDDVDNEYNNTYHSTTYHSKSKMKLIEVKESTYIDLNVESNNKDPKIAFGDRVRIRKYQSIFAESYTLHWPKEVFVINKVKNIVLWTHTIEKRNAEEVVWTCYEKELQKTNQI